MPTYEYECKKCGRIKEVFESITAKPKRRLDCETCGERTPVQRLIGAGGAIVFKGSGFYATDYRDDGYRKAAKADTAAAKSKPGDSKKSTATTETTKTLEQPRGFAARPQPKGKK